MSVIQVTAVDRHPATWEEYEALPEWPRAEYVDGCIVMAPPPSFRHQTASRRLANALEAVLDPEEFLVVMEGGWRPDRNEYIPDVMIMRRAEVESDVRFAGVPVLCAEVLSSDRAHDQVTKVAKYAEAGLNDYWILDPVAESMDVLVREGVHFRLETTLTSGTPAEVRFGGGHRVRIATSELFR